jgi:hypothetical protein
MKKLKLSAFAVLFALLAFQGCTKEEISPLEKPGYITLNTVMHKLWADHMQWTYATVDAFFNDANALQPNLDRLLKNQKDIGAAIVPYYGQAAGDQLSALLTEHIQLAVPVLQAAKSNDQAALDKGLADWNNNAEEIAQFLSAANPENWPLATMDHAMEHHISQTTTYAVDLLKGDRNQAVVNYDIAFNHMMETADLLAKGIALQFPDKL